jgi:hypothetical protein
MDPKVSKMIEKISNDLQKLKVLAETEPKKLLVTDKSQTKQRPKSIDVCTKKSELMLFTVAELKVWLLEKKTERISALRKDDLIKLVVKKLKAVRRGSVSSVSTQSTATTATENSSQVTMSTQTDSQTSMDEIDDLIQPSYTSYDLDDETDSQDLDGLSIASSNDVTLIAQIMNLLQSRH